MYYIDVIVNLYLCINIHSFIHSSVIFDPKVDNHEFPSISVFRCPFNSPYVFFPDHLSISCIHVSLGFPCFHIPSTCPSRICKCDTPADPLNTCPAYFIFHFIISFKTCNSVCSLLSTSSFVILSLKLILSIFL